MEKTIAVLEGDGIGPEIVAEAIKVLKKIESIYGHKFDYKYYPIGGAAIDETGSCLPEETLEGCKQSDSVLLGSVGGPKWDKVHKSNRPEQGLLKLRSGLGLYANLRPAKLFDQLRSASPLREDIVDEGIDFVIVRELTGGIYFGEHKTYEENGRRTAHDIMKYDEVEIRRILVRAFELANTRHRRLCCIDKANVLDSSKLWRSVLDSVAENYPDVEVSTMYVDNAAMQIVRAPSQFDVIVTENMFGDILSDEASMITGSIGMIPSSSLGESSVGMYEPIHGSAPDIAGLDKANPIGTILSAAMMLEYSFGLKEEADQIEAAINAVLDEGYRTVDIKSDGTKQVSCSQIGDLIIERLN